ncbi:MAG: type IV pili twitching motility protein PilT, partial [Elusimicrobia bacterium]|nr:type IV pili twitching motility protein PilT [Elusimicrobiota bacterium]
LCFGTLHTQDAPSTIDRIIDVFPAAQQAQVRLQVSTVLQAVVCQQLLPRKGGGRVCAREYLRVTPAVGSLIREGKTHQIYAAMEAGAKHGMIAMDQYLAFLVKQGLVELEEAVSVAHDAAMVRTLSGAGAPANAALPPR